MRIVVDTNIVFRAILNSNGRIGDLLFNTDDSISFYSCEYLQTELTRHKGKLLKAARKMTESG
ncbi:PIN domain-containing protein [Fibrella arboris]|uniref:PIN domain-containing protein n=1 Tax=Fibrella arboris TaxID=3242486 RepID=UPI003522CFC7